MAGYLESLGGVLWTGIEIQSLRSLADFDAVLFDVSPRQFIAIAGDAVPSGFVRRLQSFRYGPGVFKVDWAYQNRFPGRVRSAESRARFTLQVRLKRSRHQNAHPG